MGEARRRKAQRAGTTDDPAFQKTLFAQTLEGARRLLDDAALETVPALAAIHEARNAVLDQAVATHAAGKAACVAGCAACCHQMVLCAPAEVFALARHLLETKTPRELSAIRERLATLANLPLDPAARLDRQKPCALLEDNRCTAYAERPAMCRTMLSASREACETCLASRAGTVPYLADPAKIAAVVQLAIDYAVTTRTSRSVERVELSRALKAALDDLDGALARWAAGADPFPEAAVRPAGHPPNRELVRAAAKRFCAEEAPAPSVRQ